jgi:hypothetical protein
MVAGVSQVRNGSDRKRHFESERERSKYLSPATAMQKTSRQDDENRSRALISIKLVGLHIACQLEI